VASFGNDEQVRFNEALQLLSDPFLASFELICSRPQRSNSAFDPLGV
jgi:hypothetical protein